MKLQATCFFILVTVLKFIFSILLVVMSLGVFLSANNYYIAWVVAG